MKKGEKKLKKSDGITLIALIVTIIILIILSTITINAMKDTNLFQSTNIAKTRTMKSQVDESVSLAMIGVQSAHNGYATLQNYHDELPSEDPKIETKDYKDGDNVLKGIYHYSSNEIFEFKIYEDGKIKVELIKSKAFPITVTEITTSSVKITVNASKPGDIKIIHM